MSACALKVLGEPLRLHRRVDGSTEMLSRLGERISVALLSNENAKRAARLEDLWAFEDLRRKARDGLKSPEKNFMREKVRSSCFRDNLGWRAVPWSLSHAPMNVEITQDEAVVMKQAAQRALLDEQVIEKDRIVLGEAKLEAEADEKYQGKEAAALEKREQEAKDFILDRSGIRSFTYHEYYT